MKRILVATSRLQAVEGIRQAFQSEDVVQSTDDPDSCLQIFGKKRHDVLFIDLDFLKQGPSRKSFHPFWSLFPSTEIVVLVDSLRIREAVRAVREGASDYLTYPVDPDEVRLVIENLATTQKLHAELQTLRSQFWRKDALAVLKTQSPLMRAVFEKIRSVAPMETTILIRGETGTGKGVVANLIHRHSKRSEKQFIAVHCGAIPETLLESELFGHEKGAFTGANRLRLGKFEIAEGGTIFLDEIGTISPAMQVKLLQVLQDKTFQRLGGETLHRADVRIIAATNADLEAMCENGSFRRDLYYRLNVFPIELPPLRDRKEDIPILVEGFIEKMNRFSTKKILGVAPEVLEKFQQYHWPGNIRELENVVERAYVLERSKILTPANFPPEIMGQNPGGAFFVDTRLTLDVVRKNALEAAEREYLTRLLQQNQGHIQKTADAAGIGVRQLHNLMKKYHLRKEDFKQAIPT